MFDTIKMILLPKDLNCTWDINELKNRLEPYEKFHRWNFKPLGFLRGTISVSGNNNCLIVEGSLAKYYLGNNVQHMEWSFVRPAIRMLSMELGLPIERGTIRRCDFSMNLELDENVSDYFTELTHVRRFQRLNPKKTTLSFVNNQGNIRALFYDKLAESKSKRIGDVETLTPDGCKNLLRYEIQLQQRIAPVLGYKKIKVVHLFSPTFYEKVLDYWFNFYFMIDKKAVLSIPKHIKGRKAVDKLMFRFFVETVGWSEILSMFDIAQRNGSLSADDKSKKLKQLRLIMEDDKSFEFKDTTLELTEKVSQRYLEELSQIKKLH